MMRHKMNVPLRDHVIQLAAALALCLSTAVAAPVTRVPTPPIVITPDEAAIVTRVLGHPLDVQFNHRSEGMNRGRLTLGLSSRSGSIKIDEQTGLVIEIYSDKAIPQGIAPPEPALNVDAAQGVAVSSLQRIGIPHLEEWTLISKVYHEWGGKGSYFRAYSFEWAKAFRGVEMPSSIRMDVLADSGQIWDYILVDDPVVIPIQVNLTGEDAIRIVTQKLQWAHPVIKKASLQIWYAGGYPKGRQTVMWRFEIGNPDAVTGADSYVWADVNATTGEIISLGRPAGMWRKPKPGVSEPKVAIPQPDLKAIPKGAAPPTVFEMAAQKKP